MLYDANFNFEDFKIKIVNQEVEIKKPSLLMRYNFFDSSCLVVSHDN